MSEKILVVDDLEPARHALARELNDAGFETIEAESGEAGWVQFHLHRPDVVVSDVSMPNGTGLDLLGRIRSESDVPVVLFTAFGSVRSAAKAIKSGADDFVASDATTLDELVHAVSRAISDRTSSGKGDEFAQRFHGRSPEMQRVRERLAGLAPLKNPVLVTGPRGSGRDFAVRTLHELGASGHGTLVRISAERAETQMHIPDCSAIYLDGIERFEEHVQSFWCRYIRDSEGRSFDGTPRVFASSLTLSEEAEALPASKRILFDSMRRYSLSLPSLRGAGQDIVDIAQALVARGGKQVGRRVKLSPAALRFLTSQPFPGNVSQLEDVITRCIAFTRGGFIRREVVEEVITEQEESLETIREQHADRERRELIQAIRETGGNISRTAKRLGRSRAAVYRLIEKHQIPVRSRR